MTPFALPEKLDRDLVPVQSYWDGLRRAGNEMPFWDDVKQPVLEELGTGALLIDVFAQPERFRFNFLSRALNQGAASTLKGRFADEGALPHPFEYLRAQASAAVEARKPTYYRHEGDGGYARLLLPMWGDGRISMLLGAISSV
ncbi:hypothetical protein DW352_13630 [Pseudolabrys taiwanensis]|uniref:PAS domain-containing protein n=1 Tax=Pseudolabrys taiwanensis TaxID=331696 RepID=A0A345ZX11_9HYPH|nr:hypothetical protein [Pseudolabrys taiwanensis]AXK81458.1 hypothetical protein DW352_13630 [Pseudolabrys taiwanensis]